MPDKPNIPSWEEVFPSRASMQAAREKAEQERIAQLSAHDIWLSTLPWQTRQRVLKWEGINKMEAPHDLFT